MSFTRDCWCAWVFMEIMLKLDCRGIIMPELFPHEMTLISGWWWWAQLHCDCSEVFHMGLSGPGLKEGVEGEEWPGCVNVSSHAWKVAQKCHREVTEMLAVICSTLKITAGTENLLLSSVGMREGQKRSNRSTSPWKRFFTIVWCSRKTEESGGMRCQGGVRWQDGMFILTMVFSINVTVARLC